MNVTVNWCFDDDNELYFKALGGMMGEHTVITDPNQTKGVKPTELILMGLGSCACVDVVSILKKSRQAIADVKCAVSAKRVDAIPAVFTDIHLHFVVTGTDVKASQVAKAIELSATKYCSVGRMLANGGVTITHDFEIVAT